MTATQKNISDFQDGYRSGWEAERQDRGLDQGFAFEGPAPWPDDDHSDGTESGRWFVEGKIMGREDFHSQIGADS